MKVKCKTLKLSMIISICSVIIFTIFFLLNNINHSIFFEYINNLSLAIFGSGFVVFLISIDEYRIAKIQNLEKIWEETRIITNQLYKIKPIYVDIDSELLINYLIEWYSNQDANHRILFGERQEYYKKIYNYFLDYHKDNIKELSKNEIKKYIDDIINKKREVIMYDVANRMDEYMNLYNYNFTNINNLLGDIQFFSGKSKYKQMHNDLYKPLFDMVENLKIDVCRHIKMYKNGEMNRLEIILSIILDNQDKMFVFRKEMNNSYEYINVYNSFCDDMYKKLEKFRSGIIYNYEEQKYEQVPIMTIFINESVVDKL